MRHVPATPVLHHRLTQTLLCRPSPLRSLLIFRNLLRFNFLALTLRQCGLLHHFLLFLGQLGSSSFWETYLRDFFGRWFQSVSGNLFLPPCTGFPTLESELPAA